MAPPLDELSRSQRDMMRVLRTFVDTLRDIKKEEAVDSAVRSAIRSAELPTTASHRAEYSVVDQDEVLTRFTHGMQLLLENLSHTIKHIDEEEARQSPPKTPHKDEKPVAPIGLLSLRDYSVLQASLEVFFCWSVLPRIPVGLLLPVERRRPTKTLAISRAVLSWGMETSAATAAAVDDVVATGQHVVAATRTILQVLLLPQIQPILLPKYIVEVIALLVYSQVNEEFDEQSRNQSQQMLETLLRALPLRISMTSLRAALGQCSSMARAQSPQHGAIVPFKLRCGKLLSELLMEDGGVMTTIEMLLGAVDEGNTQARMQVATLICQCPSDIERHSYASALARQLRELLSASAYRQSKLMRETCVVIANEMATRFPEVFDSQFITPMLASMLSYETTSDCNLVTSTESTINDCVGLLHLLLCGPPPTVPLLLALVPIFRPLMHLYAFSVNSKSSLTLMIQEILTGYVKVTPNAPLLLQVVVLPCHLPVRATVEDFAEDSLTLSWSPRYAFAPGGSGGVEMRATDQEYDAAATLRQVVEALVQLLASKDFETSTVVGDLFSALLLTYTRVRRLPDGDSSSSATNTNQNGKGLFGVYETLTTHLDPLSLEMTLSLLLAIIESLGPSVLRSAVTVLRCISTVLEMFTSTQDSRLVDATAQQPLEGSVDAVSDDEDDEILTVCLGLVMTILEAGSSKRSPEEEAELRGLLPVLERLSSSQRPQIAELATDARVRILSRGTDSSSIPTHERRQLSFDETLLEASEDLQSPLVPLRARGVTLLTKLVRRSEAHRGDVEWTPRVTQLMGIFMDHLADSESYVYLAAVQGLAALGDAHPRCAIPLLTSTLRDKSQSLEKRIKLSEALLFTAKRCGSTLPQYGRDMVYSYLECIRPPPKTDTAKTKKNPFALIQEIDSSETTVEHVREETIAAINENLAVATLRASCLSNLAEVSAMLQWSLAPFAADILSCVFGILQLELDMAANSVVTVRRGAVFLLKYLLQLLGYKILDVLPDDMKTIYHTLKHVERVDRDDVVRFHAQEALRCLDDIMRAELFPSPARGGVLDGLSSLRIVKH